MPDTKRQHYVPQFYLRQFEDKDGFLWVYDKQTDKEFKCRSENICQERLLYETTWEGANEKLGKYVLLNDIENLFSGKEGSYAQIVSRVLKLCTPHQKRNALICNGKEKKLLAEFAVNLYVRNPWTMKVFELDHIPEDLEDNQELQAMREAFSLLGFGNMDSLVKAAQKKAFITDDFDGGFSVELTERLRQVELTFFYSLDAAFVTSSFPSGLGEDSSAVGVEKISSFLPLSPNVAVMFGNFEHMHDFRNRMVVLKKDMVMEFNQKYMEHSAEQVRYIICRDELLLKEMIRQRKNEV